jgi:hypothetical protein
MLNISLNTGLSIRFNYEQNDEMCGLISHLIDSSFLVTSMSIPSQQRNVNTSSSPMIEW